jgi:phosphoglucosamine mutase
VTENVTLYEAKSGMKKFPQLMINVPLQGNADPMQSAAVQQSVTHAEAKLAGRGRVLLRPSGTEPLIRVMVEGDDDLLVTQLANDIADHVAQASQAA